MVERRLDDGTCREEGGGESESPVNVNEDYYRWDVSVARLTRSTVYILENLSRKSFEKVRSRA